MNSAEAPSKEKKTKNSGSEKRQRGGIVGFRVSIAERLELEAAADRAGLTLGSHIRSCVLNSPKTRAVRRPPVEKVLLAQLLGQLGKVGGNIHQIVKHMNYGEGVDRDQLRSALLAFEESASLIMDTMGRKSP